MESAIKFAMSNNCSDIHITQGKPYVVRENGYIMKLSVDNMPIEAITEFLESVIPQKYSEFAGNEYTDIDASFEWCGRRIRANVYRNVDGISVALRILNDKIPSLVELSLPSSIDKFCDMQTGLVLVVGTAGNGKTTTLAGIINEINKTRAINILTIESPIEYVHKERLSRIVQREVGTHIDTFAAATKSAMRQDPDCVLIGELRDLETISNAITMAETGHLVFATIHAKSATMTIDRILDVFPAGQQEQIRTQLASVLRGVVYQKLIPDSTGGRVPLVEILMVDDTVSGMIRQKQNHNAIRDYMRSQGMAGSVHMVDNAVWHIKNNHFLLTDLINAVPFEDYSLISSLVHADKRERSIR